MIFHERTALPWVSLPFVLHANVPRELQKDFTNPRARAGEKGAWNWELLETEKRSRWDSSRVKNSLLAFIPRGFSGTLWAQQSPAASWTATISRHSSFISWFFFPFHLKLFLSLLFFFIFFSRPLLQILQVPPSCISFSLPTSPCAAVISLVSSQRSHCGVPIASTKWKSNLSLCPRKFPLEENCTEHKHLLWAAEFSHCTLCSCHINTAQPRGADGVTGLHHSHWNSFNILRCRLPERWGRNGKRRRKGKGEAVLW